MLVRVVGIPPGEAPEDVRRAWVGLVLPVASGTNGPEVIPGFGVLSGKPTPDADGRFHGIAQYAVPAATAVVLLEQANPQAAVWWREDAPHVVQPGQVFGFAAHVCEQVPAGDGPRPDVVIGTLLEVTYTAKLGDLVDTTMEVLMRSPAGRRELGCGWVGLTGGFVALGVLLLVFVHWALALGRVDSR